MSFTFLAKLENKNEKDSLIEQIAELEKNLLDSKTKHRIRDVLEFFFKHFVLQKKPKKMADRHLNEFLENNKTKFKFEEYQELMISLHYLWKSGNQNTHSGVDLFNFKKSLIDNLAALKRLHYVLGIICKVKLNMIFKIEPLDEMKYLKTYIQADNKLINNTLTIAGDQLVKSFAITSLGNQVCTFLEDQHVLILNKLPNTNLHTTQEMLKNILKAGHNHAAYSLGTVGVCANANNSQHTHVINGVTRVVLFYLLFKVLKKTINDRDLSDAPNAKRVLFLLEISLQTKTFFVTHSNNPKLLHQIDDLNVILNAQSISPRNMHTQLKTSEIYNMLVCMEDYLFDLSDVDIKVIINSVFEQCQIFLVNFNEHKTNEKSISLFLEQNDDVIFPLELLKSVLPKSSHIENHLKTTNHTTQKTQALDKHFFDNRNNWEQLMKMQFKNAHDINIYNLYDDSNMSYAWNLNYKIEDKMFVYYLVHHDKINSHLFNWSWFTDLMNEHRKDPTTIMSFIPYFGYFTDVTLDQIEGKIQHFSLHVIKPLDFWNLYKHKPIVTSIQVDANKQALVLPDSSTTYIHKSHFIILSQLSDLILTEDKMVETPHKQYAIAYAKPLE